MNPGRAIPRAIGASILAVAIFYVACIAVQSLGFGANQAGSAAFASSSGPLFQLAKVYVNSAVRDIILIGAASSAFGAALSEAIAGSRLLYALSRDGAPSAPLARISMPSGAPRRAVELIVIVDVVLLLIFQFMGVSGFNMWQYMGTLGTLSILVGYALVCIGASRSVLNGHLGVGRWRAVVPVAAVLLVGYTLYNELVPRPAWPYSLFPYVTLIWLAVGAGVVIFAPQLARRIGHGLTRSLGLQALGSEPADDAPPEPGIEGVADDSRPMA